jgi:hypothetical protein
MYKTRKTGTHAGTAPPYLAQFTSPLALSVLDPDANVMIDIFNSEKTRQCA